MNPDEIRELERAVGQIWEIAERFGLDPYPVHFELVPATIMYEFGAYGLPGRFSHWTHGRAYQQIKTMYDYGLSKIYELVINTNPAYAFLLENNSVLQNKLVAAHVLAHVDFFKNNAYFAHTNRSMLEAVSIHAERLRRYEFEHGKDEVERFLDAVLSIQEHIDPNPRLRRAPPPADHQRRRTRPSVGAYDDIFRIGEAPEEAPPDEPKRFPAEPEKDLLLFLAEHAPDLEPWQRDVIHIVRAEQLYFLPQMQTKIMNEGWACATGDSLVLTERGFLRFDDLYAARERIAVGSGAARARHPITDFHTERDVPTIRIRTRRGYTIEGALKHRIQLADDSWAYLSDIRTGQRIRLALGTEVWPTERVAIDRTPTPRSVSLTDVAVASNTSVWTVLRHRAGTATRSAAAIDATTTTLGYVGGGAGKVLSTRSPLSIPSYLDPMLAHLLGYFIGDGNWTKSGISLTCGEEAYAASLRRLVDSTLGLDATLRPDHTPTCQRWRIDVHSRELVGVLERLGLDPADRARSKRLPTAVLRSPRDVMAAFLRGYFDANGSAGPDGVILSSVSQELIRTVQVVLLNFGILSRQRPQARDCLRLEVKGASAARFREVIGFSMARKQQALDHYVERHRWFKREEPVDEVVSIETSRADVFDITVDSAHTYVANGLVNHNSFWHARIMRELELSEGEYVEFARLHSSVLAPSRRNVNPYYVGMKIFEDIERRWNEPTDEEREKLGRQGGEGLAKVFEVREIENDASFLRNYLTRDLVDELDLYLYRLEGDRWVIVEKDWEVVRDTILAGMTNFGQPYIVVEDGDYRRGRELYLKHCHEGDDLDLDYADKTLRYIYQLWKRPVHVETVVDGKKTVLSYEGQKGRSALARG